MKAGGQKQIGLFPSESGAEQLPFDFPLLNSQSFDDFALGDSNKDAVKVLNLWPNWNHHALILVGPEACGKTHLVNSFKNVFGGYLIDASNIPDTADVVEILKSDEQVILLDNADAVEDETALFHLYNAVKEAEGWLLLTAKKPPQQWSFKLADLASRLKSAAQVQISLPDEKLLRAVLIKQFADRQLLVNDTVINYFLKRMERSFESVKILVELTDKLSLVEGKKITTNLARQVIDTYDQQYD